MDAFIAALPRYLLTLAGVAILIWIANIVLRRLALTRQNVRIAAGDSGDASSRFIREAAFAAEGGALRPLPASREEEEEENRLHEEEIGDDQFSDTPLDRQRAIAEIVREASLKNASDIHIAVNPSGLIGWQALARVHGDMAALRTRRGQAYVAEGHQTCAAAFNIADIAESTYHVRSPQQASIVPSKTHVASLFPSDVESLRLQFMPLPPRGRLLVMRIVRKNDAKAAADVAGLGYHKNQLRDLARLREIAEGIVLFVGPVNSGKSTSLQRNLTSYILEGQGARSVTTLEDPIEFPIPGANQVAIASSVNDEQERKRTFSAYFRSTLRLDPDLVMIQEIRDEPVAQTAFEAAKAGRAIWSTLHANNAMAVFSRLREWVHHDDLFNAELVRGVVAQRLVPMLCPLCALPLAEARAMANADPVAAGVTPERLDRLIQDYAYLDAREAMRVRGSGCDGPNCVGGLAGRSLVAEILMPDRRFMDFLLKALHDPYPNRIAARRRWIESLQGEPMSVQADALIRQGIVDPRAAERQVEGIGPWRVLDEPVPAAAAPA